MEPKDQNNDKAKDQQDDKTPALVEMQRVMQELKGQNEELAKRLQAKEDAEKKAQDDSKKQKIDNDADLAKLLKDLEGSDEHEQKGKKSTDLDTLSNTELVDVIVNSVDRFVNARLTQEQEGSVKVLSKSEERLKRIEGVLGHMAASQEVSRLRSVHPDFDDLREDISKLVNDTPGLTLEKAYKLAKAERLEKEPPVESTETEFPDLSPRARVRPRDKQKDHDYSDAAGTANFRSILSAGIDRALANRDRRT